MSGAELIAGRTLHPGVADAPLLVLDEPLSLWGGVSAEGIVIDRHHPQLGTSLSGLVVAMTAGRGSSSSSSVLAELIRAGRAPAGIVLAEGDTIIVLGAIVAAELYALSLPVVEIDAAAWPTLRSARRVTLRADADGPAVIETFVDRGRQHDGVR
jgi:predicted aconitase with swiveling domain